MSLGPFGDVAVRLHGAVAELRIQRPPNNFFDAALIASLAEALEAVDREDALRVAVLASEGKHFCAGADFGGAARRDEGGPQALYDEALRLFRTRKPVVAAVQGAAIGGGLGLALAADFRVAAPEARFSANFARLGFHPGFALSVTLPRLVGPSRAAELLYTGRRVPGEEALALGLCDALAPLDALGARALGFADEIAASAPLAIESIRATLREGLAERAGEAMRHEAAEQTRLQRTADFREGIRASAERRRPDFQRR